jgi:WD40 repeat protein
MLGASGKSLAFAPGDLRLAIAGGTDAAIWDGASGRRLVTLSAPDAGGLDQIAWSPDGQPVVTGGDDGVLRFWNAAGGRLLGSLYLLESGKDWLLVTPDGRLDGTSNVCRAPGRIAFGRARHLETQRHRVAGLWCQLR